MKAVEAMRVFGVGRTALFGWLKAYRAGGERDLVPLRRGRPKGQSKLKGHEAATIVRLIMDRCPDQLKRPKRPEQPEQLGQPDRQAHQAPFQPMWGF